jgi:N-acetylglucosamine-6-phosphate deacetylase
MTTLFHNGTIFTGDEFITGSSVEVNGRILQVPSKAEGQSQDRPAPSSYPGSARDGQAQDTPAQSSAFDSAQDMDLKGGYLVPAFIDLQLYGGNGLLFGEHPSVEALKAVVAYSTAGGATRILPTVATNAPHIMHAAIEAVRSYWQQGLPGVAGLHLEGPYINPARRGAHITEFIKSPSLAEVKELVAAGKGIIKMMTLAPEVCSPEVISYLQQAGIIISAGHSDASFQQAISAFENGIGMATHLFNAMSPMQHRAPGLAGAILHSSHVQASIIADGYHVDYNVIAIAKKIMGERLLLITDAVTENKEGVYQHRLLEDRYVVVDGTLSGSALTMLEAVKNCVVHVGIPLQECLRMASLYPARVLGIEKTVGRIAPGYEAELLWLDQQLNLEGVYSNGLLTRFGA